MASLTIQITIEIDDEPEAGYARQKLDRVAGDESGSILARIAAANRATFPSSNADDITVILKAIAAAVVAAES